MGGMGHYRFADCRVISVLPRSPATISAPVAARPIAGRRPVLGILVHERRWQFRFGQAEEFSLNRQLLVTTASFHDLWLVPSEQAEVRPQEKDGEWESFWSRQAFRMPQ